MNVAAAPAPRRALRLWAEVGALYVAAPVALALFAPPDAVWGALAACFAAGLALLAATPGFSWRDLAAGPWVGDWRLLAGFTLATALSAAALALWLRPGAFLALPSYRTGLWLAILALYPFFSALPQEILYRVLFFRRYGALFPSRTAAIAANAGLFGLAHLFLWNWLAIAMTVVGGLAFAVAYLGAGDGRNLRFALLLHAIAGGIVFTAGLGGFFYHGAVR